MVSSPPICDSTLVYRTARGGAWHHTGARFDPELRRKSVLVWRILICVQLQHIARRAFQSGVQKFVSEVFAMPFLSLES